MWLRPGCPVTDASPSAAPSTQRAAELLTRPARHSARVVAATLLRAVVRRNARLQKGHDDGALHDLRVSLRRLRTWLRAMRPVLDDTVRPRTRKRLRKLAHATGRARDLEVLLEWLEKQRGKGKEASEATAVEAELKRDWQSAFDAAASEARTALTAEIEKLGKKLDSQLSHYRVDIRVDGRSAEPTMAALCGDLVAHYTARLERRLSAVHGRPDAAVAHDARIAGKRLRYLLEPLVPSLEGARGVVRRLTKLQDALGDLRDAQLAVHTLEERAGAGGDPDSTAALTHLIGAAHADVERAYARVERESLGSHAESLLVEANTVAAYLATAHARAEIERKFLLSGLPAIARRSPSARIDQGYLPGIAIEERVRRTVDGDRKLFHRTVKLGAGLERTEIEEELTEDEFQKLWRMTRGRRVHKQRYYVTEGDVTWEIDRFRDPAIIVAEVELTSANGDVPFPSWLQAVLVREVTEDPEYSNARIAH